MMKTIFSISGKTGAQIFKVFRDEEFQLFFY